MIHYSNPLLSMEDLAVNCQLRRPERSVALSGAEGSKGQLSTDEGVPTRGSIFLILAFDCVEFLLTAALDFSLVLCKLNTRKLTR